MTAALTVSIFPVDAIDQHFNYSPWLQFSTLLVLRFISCLYACLEHTRRSVFLRDPIYDFAHGLGWIIPPSSKVYSKQIYTQRWYLRDRFSCVYFGFTFIGFSLHSYWKGKKAPWNPLALHIHA